MSARPEAPPLPSIGRYRPLGRLAKGGMAEVLLARLDGPAEFERLVVLKRILGAHAEDPAYRATLLDEARIIGRIRHPNVIQVHELFEHEGDPVLVLEYLEGEPLSSVARATAPEPLPIAVAAYIVGETCLGLHAAHELRDADDESLGVVHRDVSPQNLFVTYEGSVKLLDFGIAFAKQRHAETAAGHTKGKLAFMAPEQFHHRPVDRRTDVFALGVVLHELLSGRSLFARDNTAATVHAVLAEPVPRASTANPACSPALDAVVARALERDPALRFPDALAFRRALLEAMPDGAFARDVLVAFMRDVFAERIETRRLAHRALTSGGGADALIALSAATSSVSRRRIVATGFDGPADRSSNPAVAAGVGDDAPTAIDRQARGTGEPSVGGPSVGEPSVGGPSVGEPSVGGPSVGGPSVGGPSVGEPRAVPSPVDGRAEAPKMADAIGVAPRRERPPAFRLTGVLTVAALAGAFGAWVSSSLEDDAAAPVPEIDASHLESTAPLASPRARDSLLGQERQGRHVPWDGAREPTWGQGASRSSSTGAAASGEARAAGESALEPAVEHERVAARRAPDVRPHGGSSLAPVPALGDRPRAPASRARSELDRAAAHRDLGAERSRGDLGGEPAREAGEAEIDESPQVFHRFDRRRPRSLGELDE